MVICSRKFEKFEMFCPLKVMKLGVHQKKLLHLIQPSQDPTYIYFFLIQGLRVNVEMGTKSEKVCLCVCDAFLLAYISPYISKVHGHFWLKFRMEPSIYGALMVINFCGDRGGGWGLELNFLGFQIEENFWEAKFWPKKFFPKTTPVPKKSKKMTKDSFFLQIFHSL